MTVFEDFTAGIATQAPRLVATHSRKFAGLRGAKIARNVVLDELGVRTAPGYQRIYDNGVAAPIRGIHYYVSRGVTTPKHELLVVSGGNLYADNGILWTSKGSGLTDAVKTRLVTFNGYAVFVNGVDPVAQYDGTSVANVTFTDAVGAPVTAIFPTDARPTFMFIHQNRIFYLGDAKYAYRFWTPDAGTHNIFGNNSDVIDVNLGDGQPLIGGASLTNGLAVLFKTNSIHTLAGTNPTDSAVSPFTIAVFSSELGCIAPDTIVSIGPDVYFLSQRGYKRLRYINAYGPLTDADPLHPAKPILDTMDLTRVSEANASFNALERMIYLSIPTKNGGSTTLTYNVVTEGIMERVGLNITNQLYVRDTGKHYLTRVEDPSQTVFRLMQNGISNTYDGASFASQWESLLVGTEQMNMRKFFGKFLAYTKVYNGAQVQCGVRLVNVDGSVTTRFFDFGDTTGLDGWDIGKWDIALWDNALANVLRASRVGRGVAISIFFKAAAGAAFFFDRIELDIEARGQARR